MQHWAAQPTYLHITTQFDDLTGQFEAKRIIVLWTLFSHMVGIVLQFDTFIFLEIFLAGSKDCEKEQRDPEGGRSPRC